MRDRYIDQAEAPRYNDHAVQTLGTLVGLNPIVQEIREDLKGFAPKLKELKDGAASTRSTHRTGLKGQRETGVTVATRLGRCLDDLKGQIKDGAQFDLERVFPTGTRKGIGVSIADRQDAAATAIAGLEQLKAEIAGAQRWIDELTPLAKDFGVHIETASAATSVKAGATLELGDGLGEWRQRYYGAQLIIKGLLMRVGREGEIKTFFLDLTSGRAPSKPAEEPDPADPAP